MAILRELRADGGMAPVVVCDACGQPLRDAKQGNTLWAMDGLGGNVHQAGDLLPTYFAHKGACTRALDAQLGQRLYWEPLSQLPAFLARSLNMPRPRPKARKTATKTKAQGNELS